MPRDERPAHAEMEFGRLTHTLSHKLPAKLTEARRIARATLAHVGRGSGKPKR